MRPTSEARMDITTQGRPGTFTASIVDVGLLAIGA